MVKNNIQLNRLFSEAIRENWAHPAFSDYQANTYTYQDVGEKIKLLHLFFKEQNIIEGDKIAVAGNNSSKWGITFLAILTYGAVVVPILPDFSVKNIHHIVNHSDSKLLFVSSQILEKLDINEMKFLSGILDINSFEVIKDINGTLVTSHLSAVKSIETNYVRPDAVSFAEYGPEQTCMISYTSGTSGFTKGVMLPRRSMLSNIVFAREHMPLRDGDKIVSFLPMAHVYGLLFEFLFPFTAGCHITFLTRVPSPQIVTKAFEEIRPHLILSVPLVIEKIYKKRISPTIKKPVIKLLLKVPGISNKIRNKINVALTNSFGQRFQEVIIGGAPLNEDVEFFLREIGFRYTIGYGMTECGPLITYEGWERARYRSAGRVVDRIQIKIDAVDQSSGIGEILVKGQNVMSGYYKNEHATRDVFTDDGWLKTGDLGYLDNEGYLFIKGRSKNMILGPSGQNIYPEELEAKVSNLPFVQECVVKYQDEKLIAMIYPDNEFIESSKLGTREFDHLVAESLKHLNKELPRYEQISTFEFVNEEFQKTPKRNIKRYLYT